ncbi:MAG TPA: translocation/assembly module TamB domain-containing protein [Terriglobales bacterium]|nr:translocation/assembly module TamB domain-containing protein [Terriglobales bacterium]
MEETPKTNRRRRIVVQATIGLTLIVLVVLAGWYSNSSQFQQFVRGKLVSHLEDITGGRVEMQSFQWNLSKLEFDIRNVTIHGTEAAGEIPYAHADRLLIRAKILSFFSREIGLRELYIEHPVIHIIVYPDGRTNQPTPKAVQKSGKGAVQQIFELAINHAQVADGFLIVNERRMPLDFDASQVKATMDYVPTGKRYDGKIGIVALNAKYAKFLPASATAELNFRLHPDRVEMNNLYLVSGNSKLNARGTLTNFRKPSIDVTYTANLNAGEISRIINMREIRVGSVDVNGTAHYETAAFTAKGKAVGHGLEYRTAELRLKNVDAAGEFSLDPRTFNLSHLVARVMGGIVKGDIAVANWSRAPQSTDKTAILPTGSANLKFDNMPARLFAEAVSTNNLDLVSLNPVGMGRGSLNVRWKGSLKRAVADIDVAVVPPANVAEGQLPVTGELRGTYETAPRTLQVSSLNVSTPDARLNARGTIGSRERLQLALEVTELSRMRPMFTVLRRQGTAMSDLTGQLKFDGSVSGSLRSPAVKGHAQVSNFTFPLAALMPAKVQAVPQRIHIDSGSADLAYSQQSLLIQNGKITHQKAEASFDLQAGLFQGEFLAASPLQARVSIKDADFAELQAIAGYNYPVQGTLATNLNISGTKGNLQGGGHVQLTNATLYGEPVRSASADIRLVGQEVRVENLQMVQNGSRIAGSGFFNLSSTAFRFDVSGTNIDLAKIKNLGNRRGTVAGMVNFTATGSGTTSRPVISASARLQNLVINGERVGNANITAVTQGDVLRLTARSNFQNAALTTDGTVKIGDPLWPANITVRFTNFDFMPFLQPLLQGRLSAKSYVGGSFTVQGPLRQPRSLTMVAEIPTFRADLQGVELKNPEPIRASMMNQLIRIDSFKLVGPDTQMDARGSIDLKGDRRIRVRTNGRLNMKLAQSFNEDITSAGLIDFNMSLGGVVGNPTVQGEVHVINGSVNLIDFPNGLSNINGSLVFTEDRIQVQSLAAHTGGGDIQIGGSATYSPRLSFNLTATGQDIRMRYPQGVSSTGNLDLKLTGTMQNATLSGDITVTRFGLNNQFDIAQYLAKSSRPVETPSTSLLNALHLNLHVVSTPELQVQSSLGRLAGNVDLNLRGVAANPVVLGRVNLTEGQISLNAQTYRLERGDVLFTNPARTEPTIDLEATTRVRDYELTVHLAGQPTRGLRPTFRSDPPLQEADIINLLAFGRTREESQSMTAQTNSAFTESVSNAVLGQAINTAVSDRVQRLFGVSRVKISPEIGSTTNNPTAQVTIEQQVSNKVTITYITNLTQSSQQSIFVEYNINPNVSLVTGRDQYGVVSFDVRIRHRKR